MSQVNCRSAAMLSAMTILLSVGVAAGQEEEPVLEIEPLGARAGSLAFFAGVGRVDYEERVSIDSIRSDWDGTALNLGGRWMVPNPAGYKLRFITSVWRTGDETEEWTSGGRLLQRNDMELQGFEGAGDFGLDLLPASRGTTVATVWGGVGYRRQEFERSGFFTPDETSALESVTVDETFDIAYGRVAVEVQAEISERWLWSGEVMGGGVFYNKAENQLLGSIEGGGGWTGSADARLWYRPGGRHRLGAGVGYARQELEGGTRTRFFSLEDGQVSPDVVEWPDNTLSRLLVDLQWAVDL